MYKKIRGVRDIVKKEAKIFNYVEKKAKEIFELYGYERIKFPIIGKKDLFERSVGEDNDVVQKEMYNFKDKGGRHIALRPEGTAGVTRAYIEKGYPKSDPVQKLYYFGPMFRYEKPQKGRYRQFYQAGVEVYGIKSPMVDAEMLKMLIEYLEELGLNDLTINLNNIGCKNCRPKYIKKLKKYFNDNKQDLCEDCKKRINTNPLRILDCKKCSDKNVIKNAPDIKNYLCDDCESFQKELLEYIEIYELPYKIDKNLVRGLDYYSKTVFEIVANDLNSSQNQIIGGGRYDELVEELDGPETPGLGFAFGLDRLVDLLIKRDIDIPVRYPKVFIAWYLDDKKELLKFVDKLKKMDIKVDFKYKLKNFSNQLRYADKNDYNYVIFLGENELEDKNNIHIKNMKTGDELNIGFDNIYEFIK